MRKDHGRGNRKNLTIGRAFSPNTWEAKAGESLSSRIAGQTEKPCLKGEEKKNLRTEGRSGLLWDIVLGMRWPLLS